MPRGKWTTVTVKIETRKRLEEVCAGMTMDECIKWLLSTVEKNKQQATAKKTGILQFSKQ